MCTSLPVQGVLVAERLASFHVGSVRDVTGAQLISSFSPPGCLGNWLGRLRDIRSVNVGDKGYVDSNMA